MFSSRVIDVPWNALGFFFALEQELNNPAQVGMKFVDSMGDQVEGQ